MEVEKWASLRLFFCKLVTQYNQSLWFTKWFKMPLSGTAVKHSHFPPILLKTAVSSSHHNVLCMHYLAAKVARFCFDRVGKFFIWQARRWVTRYWREQWTTLPDWSMLQWIERQHTSDLATMHQFYHRARWSFGVHFSALSPLLVLTLTCSIKEWWDRYTPVSLVRSIVVRISFELMMKIKN